MARVVSETMPGMQQQQMIHVARPEVIPLANAATVVAIVTYGLCRLLSIVAPDALAAVARSWFHGLAIGTGPWPGFDGGEFLLGFVTFGVFTWIFTAAIVWLYNQWSHH